MPQHNPKFDQALRLVNDKMPPRSQLTGALKVVMAVTETIRELKEVPSGHLYAALMGHMSLEEYESILRVIEGADLIKVDRSHLIRWIGPEGKEERRAKA